MVSLQINRYHLYLHPEARLVVSLATRGTEWFVCFSANTVRTTRADSGCMGRAAITWAEECWLHLYMLKPHYIKNFINCYKKFSANA